MHKVKKHVRFTLIAIVILVVMGGCGGEPAKEIEEEKVVPVVAISPEVGNLEVFQSFPGNVMALNEVNLTAKMGGVVEQILVREGDQVKKGDPIVILEQKDAMEQLAQAQSGLSAAQAQLKNLKEGQLPQQIAQLESGLKQAEASYLNAKDNHDRMKELFEEGAVTQQQYEGTKLQYDVAREQYEGAQTQLTLLEDSTVPESIAAMEAQVGQAKAMVALSKSGVDATVISSPIDGIVGAVGVKEGQLASPGVPVATVGNLDDVEISISVTEERIGGIEAGQRAKVTVDASGGDVIEGVVDSVSPFKDPRTMLYTVKILVKNDVGTLKSGMFARVKLATAFYTDVVTIPEEAIVFRNGDNLVFTVEGDMARAVDVKVGVTSLGKTIVEGVDVKTSVIVEGQDMLQDGAKVLIADRGSSK